MSTLTYLKNFIKDRNVASVTPTSSFGVRKICGKIDFAKARVIVEYGPATGVFSKYLLRRMRPDAALILIEINPAFASILKEEISDPRAALFHDSAVNIAEIVAQHGAVGVDTVVSGIPFSFLSDDERSEVLRNTHRVLVKGGQFLAYQTFYQNDDHLKVHLLKHFATVREDFEILNIPPMRIYEAVK